MVYRLAPKMRNKKRPKNAKRQTLTMGHRHHPREPTGRPRSQQETRPQNEKKTIWNKACKNKNHTSNHKATVTATVRAVVAVMVVVIATAIGGVGQLPSPLARGCQ
jgi:hypothetical protein